VFAVFMYFLVITKDEEANFLQTLHDSITRCLFLTSIVSPRPDLRVSILLTPPMITVDFFSLSLFLCGFGRISFCSVTLIGRYS